MKLSALSEAIIAQLLVRINANSRIKWEVVRSQEKNYIADVTHLETNLVFKNFGTTWNFLNDVKDFSHISRHHPTITTTYNKVNLKITTHDVDNRLTDKDFELAEQINSSKSLDNLK